jgi:hypothetical protein
MTIPLREPKTREEWQNAVDLSEWLLHLDAARQYGLITGGLLVNDSRAMEILDRGKAQGILPSIDCVERMTRAFMAFQRRCKQGEQTKPAPKRKGSR